MSDFLIKAAIADDLVALARIEMEAAALFPPDVLPLSARGVLPTERLQAAITHACLWVAERAESEVIGFIVATVYGTSLHVEEMDVATAHMRRGVGTQLLKHLLQVASTRGHLHVTLTTFAHVPWNAPFYRKHGFLQVQDLEQYPHLAPALKTEHERGLRHRVAMVTDISGPAVCISPQPRKL